MVKLTLTSFIDFVHKSGTPKITCVRKLKDQYGVDYKIEHDYWRLLREKIVQVFKDDKPLEDLYSVTEEVRKRDKLVNFQICIRGIIKYAERKRIKWIEVNKGVWVHGDLVVSVNPELGLEIDGKKYAVKLYFKADELTKRRAECIFRLMENAFDKARRGYIPAILDCRNAKLIIKTKDISDIDVLLHGEAASLLEMWRSL